MCLAFLAAIPAALATAGGTAGTFLGMSAATWGTVGTIASLAGTAVSTVGSIIGGNQQQQAAEYQAALQRRQARDALRRGSTAEGEHRTKTRQIIGQQRAAMGASGVVADEGSFGDLLAQSAEYGERDAQQIRVNAEREAWGYKAQAGQTSYQGDQAQSAGFMRAGTSLLTGFGNLFSSAPYWQRWKQPQDDLVTGMGY